MSKFIYKGRDIKGNFTEGKIEADVFNEAVIKLQEAGLFILDITLAREKISLPLKNSLNKKNFFKRKIKLLDLSLFCRNVSFMLKSGIPLLEALKIIINGNISKDIKSLTKGIIKELERGNTFGKACMIFTKVLPPIMIDVIKAAELGGFLDTALVKLADCFEREHHLKEKTKTVLLYPCIVLAVAMASITFILTVIIPIFAEIISEMNIAIPESTQLILNLSFIVRNYWYLLILFLSLGSLIFIFYGKSAQGKLAITKCIYQIPVLKNLLKKTIVVRFCFLFSELLQSGVPIIHSLHVIEKTIGNNLVNQEIKIVEKNIRDGLSLSDAFNDTNFLPRDVLQVIDIGGKTGEIESLLANIGKYYQSEVINLTERLPKIIEPLIILILGSVIGLIVIGVLLPILTLITNVC